MENSVAIEDCLKVTECPHFRGISSLFFFFLFVLFRSLCSLLNYFVLFLSAPLMSHGWDRSGCVGRSHLGSTQTIKVHMYMYMYELAFVLYCAPCICMPLLSHRRGRERGSMKVSECMPLRLASILTVSECEKDRTSPNLKRSGAKNGRIWVS